MFKGVPHGWGEGRDPVELTLEEMDKRAVKTALMGVGRGEANNAIKKLTDRFLGSIHVDPNDIVRAIRQIEEAHGELDIAVGLNMDVPGPR